MQQGQQERKLRVEERCSRVSREELQMEERYNRKSREGLESRRKVQKGE